MMEGIFRSDRGKVRAHNEDNGFLSDLGNQTVLATVADGMGGHQAGDVASGKAVESVKTAWEQRDPERPAKNYGAWLEKTIQDANEAVIQLAEEEPKYRGMGTTLVSVAADEAEMTIANVGDSRVYYYSVQSGELRLVTHDHSVPGELVRKGHMTQAEADIHPQKNILTRALGTERHIEVEIDYLTWETGDLLLLCSDGLSDKLGPDDLGKILAADKTIADKADEMVQQANTRGGEDNITVLILENRSKGVSVDD